MAFAERKLGNLETLLDIVHQRRDQIYTQVFVLRCNETITKTKLIDATCKWAERHPLLHAAVEIRADGRYFVPVSMDLIPSVVYWHQDIVEWIPLVEANAEKNIDSCGIPLWKMHFAPISDDGRHVMVFMVNHCIMDAQSMVQVGFELVTILNGKEDQLPPAKGLLPSMDRLLFDEDNYDGETPDLTQPWFVTGRMTPRSFTDEGVQGGKTRIIPMMLERETTQRLLEESRRHGVKLTSTLNCIASLALSEVMKTHGETVPDSFQFLVAVCLRNHLNIGLNQMGCFVAGIFCRALLQPNMGEDLQQFWHIAKTVNDDLHERMDRGEGMDCAKNDILYLKAIMKGETFPDCAYFLTSSLGSYSYGEGDEILEEKSAVKIDEVHFLISLLEENWAPPLYNALTTLNGRMSWAFVYQDRALKSSLAEEYCQRVECIVNWIVNSQRKG